MKNTKSLSYLLSVLALASTVFATDGDRGAGAGPAASASASASAAEHTAFDLEGGLDVAKLVLHVMPGDHLAAAADSIFFGDDRRITRSQFLSEEGAAALVAEAPRFVSPDFSKPERVTDYSSGYCHISTEYPHTLVLPLVSGGHLDTAAIEAMPEEDRATHLTALASILLRAMKTTLTLRHSLPNELLTASPGVEFAPARALPFVREFGAWLVGYTERIAEIFATVTTVSEAPLFAVARDADEEAFKTVFGTEFFSWVRAQPKFAEAVARNNARAYHGALSSSYRLS